MPVRMQLCQSKQAEMLISASLMLNVSVTSQGEKDPDLIQSYDANPYVQVDSHINSLGPSVSTLTLQSRLVLLITRI